MLEVNCDACLLLVAAVLGGESFLSSVWFIQCHI